jgi:hypothetical protein
MGRVAILAPIAKSSFDKKKWQLLLKLILGVRKMPFVPKCSC